MIKGNMVIGQSGGPTAAINASLAGVIKEALEKNFEGEILGMVNGIEGLLKEKFTDLKDTFSKEGNIEKLIHTPSAYLGSCRYKMPKPDKDSSVYDKVFEIFEKYNIRYFFYIGGNDSMDTVYRLSEYAKTKDYEIYIMGIPKTIDNDLAMTDHCPGYGSAAKFVATAVKEMHRDTNVYDLESVLIVEVMGRNAGWLTAASALAKDDTCTSPDLIYLPEVPFSMDKFISDVKKCLTEKKVVLVAISEGIKDENGVYVCESTASGAVDNFGHKYLSGSGKVLENAVRENLGVKARAVELNVFQRCAAHLQSKTDVEEALANGSEAFRAAISGTTGKMMAYVRCGDYKIKFEAMDISKIANEEKMVPAEYINSEGNGVTEAFYKYARPLIMGESYPVYENGMPCHLVLSK